MRRPVVILLGLGLVFVLAVAGWVVLEDRALATRLHDREERILAAPVPAGSELVGSELVSSGFCLQFGCATPRVEVRWRVAGDGDPCRVPADVARRWGLARTRTISRCGVDGHLDGTYVSLLMDADDPHLLIARS